MPKPDQQPAPKGPAGATIGRGCLVMLAIIGACGVLGPLIATDSPAVGSLLTYKLAVASSVVASYISRSTFEAGAMVCSAWALGGAIRLLLARRGVVLPPGVAIALGLGTLLSTFHATWWLAGFRGGIHAWTSPITAITSIAPIGLWLLVHWLGERRNVRAGTAGPTKRETPVTRVPLLIIATLFLVLPYATVPPGILWPSEYGGYDALSYHLPLAQEWYAQGFIAPNSHNVYSFLPNYFESAFVHISASAQTPQAAPPSADGPHQVAVGMLAKDGSAALAPQMLATFVLAIAAWSIAGLVRVLAERIGIASDPNHRDPRIERAIDFACMIAAGLVMTTPWMVVVSTLAYNEAPMVAMLAAAMSCALSPHLTPRARGVLCGVLTGFACCIKPSALVLGAPMVGIAMLASCWDAARAAALPNVRRVVARHLSVCIALCLLTGAITLSPWLIRNAIASGNPVFPFAANVLGHGHWANEQAARYAAAHKPDRGIIDAIALLVAPDPRAAPDAPAVQRFRGVTNPQWMPLAPIGALALLALLVNRTSRPTGLVLLAGSAAVALAWAAMTHAQSRFLVVLVPIAAAGAGAAIVQFLTRASFTTPRARLAGALIGATLLITTAAVWFTIGPAAQAARAGALAAAIAGPNSLSAVGLDAAVQEVKSDRQQANRLLESADPTRFVPMVPGIDLTRVLLIGDATPFYFGPVAYRTTWDTWPILAHIEAHPDDPNAWTRGLNADGFDFALVNLAEISRLSNSGYLDSRLTPDRIASWMREGTRLVRAWSDRGVFLVDLREHPDGARP